MNKYNGEAFDYSTGMILESPEAVKKVPDEEVIWSKYQGLCKKCEIESKSGGFFISTLEEGIDKLFCPRCGSEASFDTLKEFTV